ncbi:MAG: pyridoxal-phosphate dependent enzyme [Rhodospirillales bacterium]|nr:pyridoxal-phosphate dependent enzyme [Rhodospirillales bacterium]
MDVAPPIVETHERILVVRDDRFPGGTKARFLPALFATADELVYATPAEGGAQTAIAQVAAALGKRATLFVAARARPHPRTAQARVLGAQVVEVRPGYLSCARARARAYSAVSGARLMPFGLDFPEAIAAIAAAARATGVAPDEVWCAAGSGVLARGLAQAWPDARRHAVQIGRALAPADVAGAMVHVYPAPFGKPARSSPPFPSDPHYDAKAWDVCRVRRGADAVLFWNVTGPAAA